MAHWITDFRNCTERHGAAAQLEWSEWVSEWIVWNKSLSLSIIFIASCNGSVLAKLFVGKAEPKICINVHVLYIGTYRMVYTISYSFRLFRICLIKDERERDRNQTPSSSRHTREKLDAQRARNQTDYFNSNRIFRKFVLTCASTAHSSLSLYAISVCDLSSSETSRIHDHFLFSFHFFYNCWHNGRVPFRVHLYYRGHKIMSVLRLHNGGMENIFPSRRRFTVSTPRVYVSSRHTPAVSWRLLKRKFVFERFHVEFRAYAWPDYKCYYYPKDSKMYNFGFSFDTVLAIGCYRNDCKWIWDRPHAVTKNLTLSI